MLHGAAPAAEGSEPRDASGDPGALRLAQPARRASARMKLLDDPLREQSFMGRNTVPVPSFATLDREGAVYPEHVNDRTCQWDRYPIPWRPVGLPTQRYKIAGKLHYVCIRWFCSRECAKAFCKEHCKREPWYARALTYLDEMHRLTLEELGQEHEPLRDADDWNLLKYVGSGAMEVDDFRASWKTRYLKETAFIMYRGVEAYIKTSKG